MSQSWAIFFPVFKLSAISLYTSWALPKGPYMSPSLGHSGKNSTKALQGIRTKLMLTSKHFTYILSFVPTLIMQDGCHDQPHSSDEEGTPQEV